jgi:hypothetical protein
MSESLRLRTAYKKNRAVVSYSPGLPPPSMMREFLPQLADPERHEQRGPYANASHPRDLPSGTGLRLAEIVGLNVGAFAPDGTPRSRRVKIGLRSPNRSGGSSPGCPIAEAPEVVPRLQGRRERHRDATSRASNPSIRCSPSLRRASPRDSSRCWPDGCPYLIVILRDPTAPFSRGTKFPQ